MKIKTFLDLEFKSFSTYDCTIKLPSLIDGMKSSQRKIIHTVTENNRRMKVEALAPFTQSYTEYHHGAVSLEGVIVKLARDFVGSNNISYLIKDGQFGNRLKQDASASRYIHVQGLNPEFKKVFKPEDAKILEHHIEDGARIEPKFYLPVIPAALITGSEGIATGFASKIFSYNPKDLKKAVEQVIDGKKVTPLIPWYKGFTGNITKVGNQTSWYGVVNLKTPSLAVVTELPIGYDQEKYNDILDVLEEKGKIRSFIDKSRMGNFLFEIKLDKQLIGKTVTELIDELKLIDRGSENITGWSYEPGKLIEFETIEEYIKWWTDYRLTKIDERRTSMIQEVAQQIDWLKIKKNFIDFYLKLPGGFSKLKKFEIKDLMLATGFAEEHHDRLLDIKIYNLTEEQIAKLVEEIQAKDAEKVKLESVSREQMFKEDLKAV